jgi:hypothetical protein
MLAFSSPDSNHSSRRAAQLIVIVLIRNACSARGSFLNPLPSFRRPRRSEIPADGSGGGADRVGRMKSARRAIAASKAG